MAGSADTLPAGAAFADTETWTDSLAERPGALPSVTVSVSVMVWACLVAAGAVHVVSAAAASSNDPLLLVQA